MSLRAGEGTRVMIFRNRTISAYKRLLKLMLCLTFFLKLLPRMISFTFVGSFIVKMEYVSQLFKYKNEYVSQWFMYKHVYVSQ